MLRIEAFEEPDAYEGDRLSCVATFPRRLSSGTDMVGLVVKPVAMLVPHASFRERNQQGGGETRTFERENCLGSACFVPGRLNLWVGQQSSPPRFPVFSSVSGGRETRQG